MPPNVAATSAARPASRPLAYDAGELLKSGVDSILRDDTNGSIDANIANIDAALKSHGVRNTKFVGQLLYCFRGVQQGVSGDLQKFKQAVSMAQSAGVLGPRGASSLLAKVGVVAQQQDDRARVDNSILNVNNQPRREQSLFETPALLKGTSYEYKKVDSFTRVAPQQPERVQAPAQPKAEKREASPALEQAITAVDATAKSMPEGVLKDGLEGITTTLETMKEAQTRGDKATYARCVTELSKESFSFVGHLVETVGQDPELAEQAAKSLGSIAGVVGKVATPFRAVEDASKIVLGKTLTGAPVEPAERADAVVDLAATLAPGPVGAGILISTSTLKALYNHIGVPAHRAVEEYGLKRLFNGKTPDELKAQISQLSTDDASTNATVKKLLFDTFPNTTSGMSEATASSLWRSFVAKEMSGDAEWIKMMVNQDPKKPNGVPDMLRETVADRMKSAAIRFIDQQVSEARGNW